MWGGVVALHRLCYLLRQRGANAAIYSNPPTPDIYGNSIVSFQPDIAIYPEVVNGNPLNARHVVRWLLNTPGAVVGHDGIRGDGVYGHDDLICHYADRFAVNYPQSELLFTFDLFPQWIHNEERESRWRQGDICVVRKGRNKKKEERILDARELLLFDCQPYFFGWYARRAEHFYSYDTATWLSVQAVLCGCKSTVIPDDGVSAEQWRESHWLFKHGIGYGLDDDYGDETRDKVKPWLAECEKKSFATVDRLLERSNALP